MQREQRQDSSGYCSPVPCRARWAHSLCVCVHVCVGGSDWHIGMPNCRCVEPLPSLLPSITNKEKGKQFLCAHIHTNTPTFTHTPLQSSLSQCEPLLLFMSTLIRVSGKGSWTAHCVGLASFYFDHWLMSRHALPLPLYLFASPHQRVALFHFYAPFHSASKTTVLVFNIHVCVGAVGQYN